MTRRSRHFRFSLRTILVVVALCAVCLTGWRTCVEPYRQEQRAMEVVQELGGSFQTRAASNWRRRLIGNNEALFFVNLTDCDAPDDYLE